MAALFGNTAGSTTLTKVLVTGDREWSDGSMVKAALSEFTHNWDTTVIQGGARGADWLADLVALQLGMARSTYPAYWNCSAYEKDTGETCDADSGHRAVHGRPAGVIRNQRMLDEGKPDVVYAFHDDLEKSKGTKDMVKRAKRAGIPVTHFSHQHPEGIVL